MVAMPYVFLPLLEIYYEFQLFVMLYQIYLHDNDFDPKKNNKNFVFFKNITIIINDVN